MKQDNAQPEGTVLSKPELVWKAIEELGYHAEVSEILEFVRTRYGIEQGSTQKAAAAPAPPTPITAPARETPAPKLVEQEPARKPASQRSRAHVQTPPSEMNPQHKVEPAERQPMGRSKKEKAEEMTSTESTTSPSDPQEKPEAGNKPKKTEMVRQAIEEGRKRKPLAIQAWILEKYGETVPTQHISTIKSNLRKNPGRRPRKSSEHEGESAGPNGSSESLSLEEIRIVKALIGRIGRTRFEEVLELLS